MMPVKRGRKGSIVSEESTSVTDYTEDSLQSVNSSISTRKKRKLINSKLEVDHCQELIDKIKDVKAEDGHFLTDSFLKLPKKRNASDYYDVVTSPIDLSKIQLKITNHDYETFLDFEKDIEQLVNNAKMYHTSSAIEYQEAVEIWSIYEQEKQNIVTKMSLKTEYREAALSSSASFCNSASGSESRSRRIRKRIAISVDDGFSDQISMTTSEDSKNRCEISLNSESPLEVFFAAVVAQRTDSRKDIMPTFTFLPSKHMYPQYYEIIKEPIDLRMIAQKIKSGTYSGIDDLERDFNTMIKNAKLFNEPKSDVYQEAIELQKIIKAKRQWYDQGSKQQNQSRRQKRIPSKITDKFARKANPKENNVEKNEYVDDLEKSMDVDKDLEINASDINRTQQWQLYKSLLSVNFTVGSNPSAAFMKLPSKKLYPDYYLEISEPMSLLMVKAKINKNLYRNVDETLRDINLVFNNAQQFNVENSVIYKDAVKLQQFVNLNRSEMIRESLQCTKDKATKKTKSSVKTPKSKAMGPSTPRRTRPPISPEELRVKRINNIFQAIYSYQEENRFLRDIFMTIPSRELYPNYYQVIPKPIDLTIIRKKIDDNKYQSYADVVEDLTLMFNNAKHFNEESSQVYHDTLTLEKVLRKKLKTFTAAPSGLRRGPKKKIDTIKHVVMAPSTLTPNMHYTPMDKIQDIFQTIKEYRDISGRLLLDPFAKLPPKSDMPEYYEIIKNPIEIETIQYRINNERYQNIEEFMDDIFLLFDNACQFNDPDSQIYRDALILLRVCLAKKAFLTNYDNLPEPPNVQSMVNEMMLSIYTQFLNCTDEDGRYLVDSLREIDGKLITRKPRGDNPSTRFDYIIENVCLNLDVIKHNLEKKRYKRLDRLQADVFSYLKHVRTVSKIESQAFDDAWKLQKFFIIVRDNECERGDRLLTPALHYTEESLNQEIELFTDERHETVDGMITDEDCEYIENIKKNGNYRMLNSITRNETNFQIGDFVRIQKEPGEIPRIGEICAVLIPNSDDIHTDDCYFDGSLVRVNWYYYPQQTIHKSTKRIMEREIFQTSVYESVSVNKIMGKCLIMYIKDYLRQTSKNFAENDIFVCESTYSVKDNSFKKLKKLIYKNQSIDATFINRDEPIILNRNFSTFLSESVTFDFNDFTFTIENAKESVLKEDDSVTECCVYYDQLVSDNGFSVKVGDYVYVDDEASQTQIVRIDNLWKNNIQDVVYFSGPWYLNALNCDHLPSRMFYRKEVFLSSSDAATHLLTSIIGKCVILSFSEYCKYRPTEYSNDDVYICQYKYFTDEKVARKLKKDLKKTLISTKALEDEIYFFKTEFIPNKEPSTMLSNRSTEPIRQEFITRIYAVHHRSPSHYHEHESIESAIIRDESNGGVSGVTSVYGDSVKKPTKKIRKPPSGYALYAGEVRKQLLRNNPSAVFGVISKEVGQMWRKIPQSDKDAYERRAFEIKHAMEQESALAEEIEFRKNESKLQQQSHIQSLSQSNYTESPTQKTLTNCISSLPTHQTIHSSSPNSFQGNSPIQYFNTSNGQVLQYMPTSNIQPSIAGQFLSPVPDEQVSYVQQSNQSQQPVIYKICSTPQSNQQVICNQAQLSTVPQMMVQQQKGSPFNSPQLSTSPKNQPLQSTVSEINMHQAGQNHIFSGFPVQQRNIPSNIVHNQIQNVSQNPVIQDNQARNHFITVSSKNTPVLHSDIYQKYIEKLRKNSSTLSDWKPQLQSSKESMLAAQGTNRQMYMTRLCQDVAPAFLDSRQLTDKDGRKLSQESIVDCLFRLRDHMLQDAMNIRSRVVGLSEL